MSAVAVVAILSLAIAAGVWLRPGWRWLLLIATIAMLVFAIFDVREVVHQVDEAKTGLVVAASIVAVLHVAAAAIGLVLLIGLSGAEPARRPGRS